ncbi:MAG TPA: CmcJ/NvfI family oxidoreductase [Caulobacteraceae bacterium]
MSDTADLTRGAVRPSGARTVWALINYLEDDTPDSVWYAADSWRSHMPLRMETMEIEDVRQIRGAFSLDREGIFLADAPSSVKDFRDREATAKVYLPEIEEAVRAVTGAHKVVAGRAWVHRHSDRSERFGEAGTTFPGRYAHIDYSDESGPATARQMLGDDREADALMAGRFAIFNLWRAISPPPQDCPLCVVDATTVAAEDLVISHIVLGPAEHEMRLQTNMVAYNPLHRWVYFPDMDRDELLIFRGYDSDPARSRRVPHTAFDDPGAGEHAPPRESIDIRCVAFFD